jgi:hypothetical protein
MYHRFMPCYLGMIDIKYVLINSFYLLVVKFDMSITGFDGWFNFVI